MMYSFDETVLRADTPEELVAAMRSLSFAPAASDEDWMEETAKRAYQQTGQTVRFGTAEDFIKDMLAAGLIAEHYNNGDKDAK